jgi:hypothetical protein
MKKINFSAWAATTTMPMKPVPEEIFAGRLSVRQEKMKKLPLFFEGILFAY